MDYITVKQAAEKWHVSVRMVQHACQRGGIPGVMHHGREWMIPAKARKPKISRKPPPTPKPEPPEPVVPTDVSPLMPLLNTAFAPGDAKRCISRFADADTRAIARAEYFYFSGHAAEASKAVEPYLTSSNPALQLSAYLIYAYANLTLGHTQLSSYALAAVMEGIRQRDESTPPALRAVNIFIANTAAVLLHLPMPDLPPMAEALPALPQGLRFFACYITAHQAYLEGDYNRSLGLVEAAFAMADQIYPIPAIYLHLMAAMDYMSLKRPAEGRAAFERAWQLAEPDDLIEAFGEHHGLLEGLVEACLQQDAPAAFERIITITYAFSDGWRRIHNPHTQEEVAGNLSTREFTIAMLANRGWSNKEIAIHLGMTDYTVKYYISQIYQKLGIVKRKQLEKYMLR